jgi:hypothetical protein
VEVGRREAADGLAARDSFGVDADAFGAVDLEGVLGEADAGRGHPRREDLRDAGDDTA